MCVHVCIQIMYSIYLYRSWIFKDNAFGHFSHNPPQIPLLKSLPGKATEVTVKLRRISPTWLSIKLLFVWVRTTEIVNELFQSTLDSPTQSPTCTLNPCRKLGSHILFRARTSSGKKNVQKILLDSLISKGLTVQRLLHIHSKCILSFSNPGVVGVVLVPQGCR